MTTNWKVLAKPYDSDSSISDKSIFQSVKFDENVVLKAVMAWVMVFNNPTFNYLFMDIYSDDDQQAARTPKKLLHTSTNMQLKAEIHSLNYACKEVYFEFGNINLRRETWFNFSMNANGYSDASAAKHLAWKSTYPDPQYPEGVTLSQAAAGQYPLTFVPIFAEYEQP